MKRTRKNERRAELEESRLAAEREAANTVPRELSADIRIRGIGLRRCQLIRIPSFTFAESWDIREVPHSLPFPFPKDLPEPEYKLYRSIGTAPGARTLVGYQEVSAPDGMLERYLRLIAELPLALRQVPALWMVADGVRLELALQVDFDTSARLRWLEGTNCDGWCDLDALAREMLGAFGRLDPAVSPGPVSDAG